MDEQKRSYHNFYSDSFKRSCFGLDLEFRTTTFTRFSKCTSATTSDSTGPMILRGVFFAVLAAMSWGLVYVLEQIVLNEFSVAKFIVYQSLFMGVIALVFVIFLPHEGSALSLLDWKILLQPTFLILMAATFLAEFLILKSVQGVGAHYATLFEISFPFFTAIFAYYILQQPLQLLTFVGGLFILVGSGIIIYVNKLF